MRKRWQRTFSFRRKQSFRGELLLELFETELQGPDALKFDGADDELILSAGFVNRHVTLQQNLLSVRKKFAMRNSFAAKQHATDLRSGIFQREIPVAGTLRAQVRDFAADPNLPDRFFEQAFDLNRQFTDRQDLARCFRWKQFAKIPLRFVFAH